MISEFVDSKIIDALDAFLKSSKDDDARKATVKMADVFGAGAQFKKIAEPGSELEQKLISSFQHNLVLLIQKTWVEKTDEELKAKVLYQLEEFCSLLKCKSYTVAFTSFFEIVETVVYLMFGNMSQSDDFDEYALRIDPEFGIFWWYMKSLPKEERWAEGKSRLAILLGMYFLANY